VFGLAVAAFAFITLAVATGQRGGETFSDNWLLAVPALLAGFGAVGSAAVGAYAILRHREHSLLVYLLTAIGLLMVAFVVGEGFNTH
jgi:hypothetical protein